MRLTADYWAPCSSLPLSVETSSREVQVWGFYRFTSKVFTRKEISLQILFVKEWSQIREMEGKQSCARLSKTQGSSQKAHLILSQGTFYGCPYFNVFPSQFFATCFKMRNYIGKILAYFNVHKMPSLALNLCHTEHDALRILVK